MEAVEDVLKDFTEDQLFILSIVVGVLVISILLYCLIDLIASCLRFLVVLLAFAAVGLGIALHFALEPPESLSIEEIQAVGGQGIEVADGRLVEYFDIGPKSGKPVVLIHAHSMSGRYFVYLETFAAAQKLRIIAPSLPGWGLSDPNDGREYSQWPVADLVPILDQLGINQFVVAGIGFGGVHAAATAVKLKERVTAVALLAPLGPSNDENDPFEDAPLSVELASKVLELPYVRDLASEYLLVPALKADPENYFKGMIPIDATQLDELGEKKKLFLEDAVRAVSRTSRGFADTNRMSFSPWGFDMSEISRGGRKVIISTGEKDQLVRPSNQIYIAQKIPNCQLIEYKGETHFHTLHHLEELLNKIV